MKQEQKSTGALYLRDLKPEAQELVRAKIIESNRHDLITALKKGDDIQIGYWWQTEEYEVV